MLNKYVVRVYFAGTVNNEDPTKRPSKAGYITKKLVVNPVIAKTIADAFKKVNEDISIDSEAAAKASLVAKKLRKL